MIQKARSAVAYGLHGQIDWLSAGHDARRGIDAPERLVAAAIRCCQIGQRSMTHALQCVSPRLAEGWGGRQMRTLQDVQRTFRIRRESTSSCGPSGWPCQRR